MGQLAALSMREEKGAKESRLATAGQEDKSTAGGRFCLKPYLARRGRLIWVKLGGGLGFAVP